MFLSGPQGRGGRLSPADHPFRDALKRIVVEADARPQLICVGFHNRPSLVVPDDREHGLPVGTQYETYRYLTAWMCFKAVMHLGALKGNRIRITVAEVGTGEAYGLVYDLRHDSVSWTKPDQDALRYLDQLIGTGPNQQNEER